MDIHTLLPKTHEDRILDLVELRLKMDFDEYVEGEKEFDIRNVEKYEEELRKKSKEEIEVMHKEAFK